MPQTAQENKMGVMPVRRLLITMALPMMISMLVQALYNVVDSIFVAQISESALTAVSLVFPFQNLMISIGVPALRIISISFLLASGSIISISTLQALGKGVQSMMISFTRQLIVLLPVAWLLSLRGTLESIWWAFPIAEVVTLALSVFLLARAYRTLVKPMPDEE